MEELVKSIDALSREQLALLVTTVGLSRARVPVLLPGAAVGSLPLAPTVSAEDRMVGRGVGGWSVGGWVAGCWVGGGCLRGFEGPGGGRWSAAVGKRVELVKRSQNHHSKPIIAPKHDPPNRNRSSRTW